LSQNCTKFIVRNGLALELRICGSLVLSSDWGVPCSPSAANARRHLPPIRTGIHPQIPEADRPAQASINSQAPGADNRIAGGG